MEIVDMHAEARREWLRLEQQPRVKQQTPQSNFEESPCWRICIFVAVVIIGIQVFMPNPDNATEPRHSSTIQTGHVRPMV